MKTIEETIPVRVRRTNKYGVWNYSVVVVKDNDLNPEHEIHIRTWSPDDWASIFQIWEQLNK